MLQDRMSQVRAKVLALVAKYENQTGVKLPTIKVLFNLRGKVAGQAGHVPGEGWIIKINSDMMMNDSWDHIFNDTVPHELAHVICMYRRIDSGHGYTWRSTCWFLGGSGSTYHQERVVYARGRTFEYTTSNGRVVNISETRHRRVQACKQTYVYRDGSRIDHTCKFRLVA